MTKLVIVESPAKCKKIETFLGAGYRCIASFGHIRELDNGLKGININNNFSPKFRFLPSKTKYIKSLRAAIKKTSEVILATDDDREGEAIAWHICKAFNLPLSTTKRIIFHEVTKSAVQNAIKSPTTVNINKVHAQQARQILDCLVGFTISPILWQHISRKTGLSAGRCQTPALRLVYDNQQDIDSSPGRVAYDTIGYFTNKNLDFKLNYHHPDQDSMAEFLESSAEWKHVFTFSNPVAKIRLPPRPLTTSALQQKSSNELHYSPKQTMRLAQKLYEQGYITYMRTDSRTYSTQFIATAKKFISEKWGNNYINAKIHSLSQRASGKANAQEAHEAIRPTKIKRVGLTGTASAQEQRLYKLIWQHTAESCMAEAKYNLLCASITAPEKHKYRYSTELVTFPGWLIIGGYEKSNPIYDFILSQSQNSVFPYNQVYSKMSMKDMKTHFTEARLVQQLEKVGIGRPSTFSSLIAKIQDRGYVKKGNVEGKECACVDFKLHDDELEEIESSRVFGNEKNKLIIQPTGLIVIEFLIKHFDKLFVYPYTKNMEDALDEISKGAKLWYSLCDTCHKEMTELSAKIQKGQHERIRIDDNHVYMIAKYGPVIKCEVGGKTVFKSVKKNLDMNKLKRGGYELSEIIEEKPAFGGRRLGSFKNNDVLLKKGKYGLYLECGDSMYSLKWIKKPESSITLEDVLDILLGKRSANPNILNIVNKNMSVRKGKFGPYLFYKTSYMKKPRFMNFKGKDWREIPDIESWVSETYGV